MKDYLNYDNPLIARYASKKMSEHFGPQKKFSTWRKLWIALAEAELELGLPVTQAQIDELKEHVDDIDFDVAAAYEKKLRHDVMAHVHTYGDLCPNAKGIIHLGATSCFVTDNGDAILYREALRMVRDRLVVVIDRLAKFAARRPVLYVPDTSAPCPAHGIRPSSADARGRGILSGISVRFLHST